MVRRLKWVWQYWRSGGNYWVNVPFAILLGDCLAYTYRDGTFVVWQITDKSCRLMWVNAGQPGALKHHIDHFKSVMFDKTDCDMIIAEPMTKVHRRLYRTLGFVNYRDNSMVLYDE